MKGTEEEQPGELGSGVHYKPCEKFPAEDKTRGATCC